MKLEKIMISILLLCRMLIRRRITVILVAVIPAVFMAAAFLTASERIIPFRLASVSGEVFLKASERNISLLFLAVASVGFLSSYFGLYLLQQHTDVNRRLVLCGYHPVELFTAHLTVLLAFVVLIALYITLALLLFFTPERWLLMFSGLLLAGIVYGSYGMAVGSLIKGELEGILLIVLLANIDAGWLQNPLFYAEAENKLIIRLLPAYFPSQTAIAAAFSDYATTLSMSMSGLYSLFFLAGTMAIYFIKMKV